MNTPASAPWFRAIADSATDAIVASDETGLIRFLSRGAQTMFGYAESEALGQPIGLLVPEEHRAAHQKGFTRFLATREGRLMGQVVELEGRRRDGHGFPIELSLSHCAVQGQLLVTAVIRDITRRKALDDTMRFLAEHSAPATPEGFFRPLARFLAGVLEADFICVDRLSTDDRSAETLAVFADGQDQENISYGLKDTPCSQLVGRQVCVFPRGVRTLFPHDEILQTLQAEGYVGVSLRGSSGRAIGLIAAITRRPLLNTALPESVLQLVAVRAAGEIEREGIEAALRAHNDDLQRFNSAMVDRELRMVQLKEEVNALCVRLGEPPPYFASPDPQE
jgi:PAS domain S-box-containing protein